MMKTFSVKVGWSMWLTALLSLLIAWPVTAEIDNSKFRNAINFEGNEFVGMYNVEVKHGLRSVEGATPSRYDRTELNYALTYGVFMNYEITLDLPVKFHENGPDDIGDLGLKQRLKFTEQETGFADSSGGIELILPTGNDGTNPPTGTDDVNFRLFGSVGHALTTNTEWLLNAGYTIYGEDQIDDRFQYNGAVAYRATDQLKLNVEANGWTGGRPDNSEIYLSPGLIYQPRAGFSLTLSAPVGLNSDSADHRGQIEMIFEF